ncbi:hypothetical protein NC651_033040 [Populus alba x Populus x berolinensis]|nr:hypothetical protein NC651_033039 [Populus alba x Populus x berolinensis]KAJ6867883.1 hypothetical protein NC651_033040 [Populus alba x Populus x berolinensis]
MGAGGEVMVEPHGHEGAFIAKGEEDALVTKKMVPDCVKSNSVAHFAFASAVAAIAVAAVFDGIKTQALLFLSLAYPAPLCLTTYAHHKYK